MTLPRRALDSIDDIAHYLKLLAAAGVAINAELEQMNRREEAKIRSDDDVQRYIRETDDDD